MRGEIPAATMTRRSVMLLLTALAVASAASGNGQSHIMQVQRFVNGNPVPQGSMMIPEQAAAAISALTGDMTQSEADDRSLKLVAKAIPIVGLTKWKKKKKSPIKSPLKSKFKLPLFLGGAAAAATATKGAATAATAASAASAASAAAAGLPAGLANLLGPGIISSTLPVNAEVPIWKVHRYNGIDIRPVRLSELVPSPALPPPSELTPQDGFTPVASPPPSEVNVPEPLAPAPTFGTPADTFPTSADTITFPSTPQQPQYPQNPVPGVPIYNVPAPVYGGPAPTYGVPAPTYGVPAPTYGVPAPTYGVPVQGYGAPIQSFQPQAGFTQQVTFPSESTDTGSTEDIAAPAEQDENTSEGLEALSSLGALTDFIPGGGSGSRFPSLFSLASGGRGRGSEPFSFFNRFIRGQQPAETAQESQNTIYTAPQPSAIQNLLGRIPIISSLTNFGGGNTNSHVALPPLPELPSVPDITNVQGLNAAFSQVPHIRLPTRYVLKGTPYTSIRYPQLQNRPVNIGQPSSVAGLPAPLSGGEGFQASEQTETVVEPTSEPVEPVRPEPSYPLPLEQPQVQPQPQTQYGYVNSYGQPIVQTGYYVTPVISAPAPPQFTVPFYSTPVAAGGVPASTYGPPQDAAVAASEIDATAVAVAAPTTECTDSNCGDTRTAKNNDVRLAKVTAPEGQTRSVKRDQTAPIVSPVFKKDEAKEVQKTKEAEIVEDLTRYLDPEHPAATKINTQEMEDSVNADASPSMNTEDDDES